MSIATNNSINAADVNALYTDFNTFIATYGGGVIAQISNSEFLSTGGSTINAAQVNKLYSKINEFRSDDYLKTQLSFWPAGSVTQNNIIYASDMNNINTAKGNFASIKCRNLATNNYSNHNQDCEKTCGAQSCTYDKNSNACANTCSQSCTYDKNANACSNTCTQSCSYDKNGNTCSNTCSQSCTNSAHSQGCSHGTNGNTCSNGNNSVTVSYGTYGEKWCNRNPNSRACFAYGSYHMQGKDNRCSLNGYTVRNYMCMYQSGDICDRACNWVDSERAYKSARTRYRQGICTHNTCSQSQHGQTCSQTCSIACSNTCSQSCSNSTHSQTCSRTCTRSCTHNNHSQDCSRTCSRSCTHNDHSQDCSRTCNRSCTYDKNANTCSNTTVIDILCQHNPKANTSGT